jgi:hypothetical protein
MIYIFNLNNYIGGGEVYVLQLAKYLTSNNIDFTLITVNNGYIAQQAIKKKYKKIIWPINETSILYSNKREKIKLKSFVNDLNFKKKDIVLSCNMRELYNCFFMMKNSKKQFILKNIILHPEEYKYSSNLSLNPKKQIFYNRSILTKMDKNDLNIYPNQNARNQTIGKKLSDIDFFPFPIENVKHNLKNKEINPRKINLLTISRFVSFKISTTISLITFVKKNKNFTLNIIGYGPWKFLINIFLFFYKSKRIKIYPKQNLEDLKLFIVNCDIGFAQGTTILQIAKFKKPVVVAPYSKWYDFILKKIKSPQVFGDTKTPDFGDNYYMKNLGYHDYKDLFDKVVLNYTDYVSQTEDMISSLERDKIFTSLLSKLKEPKYFEDYKNVIFPKPSFFKTIIRKIFYSI